MTIRELREALADLPEYRQVEIEIDPHHADQTAIEDPNYRSAPVEVVDAGMGVVILR